jgi:hypothetical protein
MKLANMAWELLFCTCFAVLTAHAEDTKTDFLFQCHFNGDFKDIQHKTVPRQVYGKPVFVDGTANTMGVFLEKNAALIYPIEKNFNMEEGTVSFWIKPSGWSVNTNGEKRDRTFFTIRPKGTHYNKNLFVLAKNMYGLYFLINDKDGKTSSLQLGQTFLKENEWVFIAITWKMKSNELYGYVNGVLKGRNSNTTKTEIPFDMNDAGAEFNIGGNLNAVMDELIIADTMKPAEEIMAMYKKPLREYHED